MDNKNQIEINEFAKDLHGHSIDTEDDCVFVAKCLIDKGYKKQLKGTWKLHNDGSGTCDQCHKTSLHVWDFDNCQMYCGHCGALMDI